MTEFVRYNLGIPLIKDLPERVVKILDYLAGIAELSEDFELPDEPFFDNDNWKKLGIHTSDEKPDYGHFFIRQSNLLLMAGIDYKGAVILPHFLRWIFPYTTAPRKSCSIGTYSHDSWAFPVILIHNKNGLQCFDLEQLLSSETCIIFDPQKLSGTAVPAELESNIEKLAKGLLEKLKARGACEECGDCEEEKN